MRASRGVVLVVCCLLLISGCSFLPAESTRTDATTAPPPSSAEPPRTTSTTTEGQASATPTSRETDTPPQDSSHPWAGSTVVVGINDSMPGDRNYTPLVRQAFAEWNGSDVSGGRVHFEVHPDATSPDVRVDIVPTIRRCGGDRANVSFEYCISRLGPGTQPGSPEVVEFTGRFDDETFLAVASGGLANLVNRDPDATAFYPIEEYRYADPWPGSDPVVINITNRANRSRNIAPLVNETVEWWADRPASQKNYTTTFVVRPNASDADLEVALVESVERCGLESGTGFIGCADKLNRSVIAASPTVEIEAGYTPDSTLVTLKHEFGHVYGREHGQSPIVIMQPTQEATEKWPRPDATERPFAWQNRTLSVYIDARGGTEADTVWADIQPALEYYRDGAGGWLSETPRFERVSSADAADITIATTDESVCGYGRGGGVCNISRRGINTDSDSQYEFYTEERLTLTASGKRARSWMVGYALAFVLGADDPDGVPEPFQDVTNSNDAWWLDT